MSLHEQRVPFYIPGPAGAGATNIITIHPQTFDRPAEIEIVCASGGPLFLWRGRRSASAAYKGTHATTAATTTGQLTADVQPEFDLCAGSSAKARMSIGAISGEFTLASDNESIGVIIFREKGGPVA